MCARGVGLPQARQLTAQGQPVANPSRDVSLRLRPPEALDKRPVEVTEDFREYIKEVHTASICCQVAGGLAGDAPLSDGTNWKAHAATATTNCQHWRALAFKQ